MRLWCVKFFGECFRNVVQHVGGLETAAVLAERGANGGSSDETRARTRGYEELSAPFVRFIATMNRGPQ